VIEPSGNYPARRLQKPLMIVMAVVCASSLVLAVYNGTGHRWASMTGNLCVVVGMALSLLAQRQLKKQRSQQARSR